MASCVNFDTIKSIEVTGQIVKLKAGFVWAYIDNQGAGDVRVVTDAGVGKIKVGSALNFTEGARSYNEVILDCRLTIASITWNGSMHEILAVLP